jgi:hypothetical protein
MPTSITSGFAPSSAEAISLLTPAQPCPLQHSLHLRCQVFRATAATISRRHHQLREAQEPSSQTAALVRVITGSSDAV